MLEKLLINTVRKLRKVTGLYTYQLEYLVVIIILVTVAVINKSEWVEWVGSAAVFITFMHAKVANRLAEREKFRQVHKQDDMVLSYHYKIGKFFVAKEILWFAYFILLGAWSALAGVIIFLLYEPWRKLWRKHHPLKEKIEKEKKK